MSTIEERLYARVDDVENGCCAGSPVMIWKALHMPSGEVTYSAVCSCGGWCTNGHNDPWDALEEYQEMTEEEKRRNKAMKARARSAENPGPFSESASCYFAYALDSGFHERLRNELKDLGVCGCDANRAISGFTLEAYQAGYADGKLSGIEAAER